MYKTGKFYIIYLLLSLIPFVAIYALLGGPALTINKSIYTARVLGLIDKDSNVRWSVGVADLVKPPAWHLASFLVVVASALFHFLSEIICPGSVPQCTLLEVFWSRKDLHLLPFYVSASFPLMNTIVLFFFAGSSIHSIYWHFYFKIISKLPEFGIRTK